MSKEKAKEIREKALPFVTWLRIAEEETSDEEEGQFEPGIFLYWYGHSVDVQIFMG